MRSLVSGLMLVIVAGCTAHVSIVQRGYVLVQSEPTQGAVHPYPGLSIGHSQGVPIVAVFLSTKSDLERLARRRTHHLYFELLPCSQNSHGFDLFSGTVFDANDDERRQMLGPTSPSEVRLYKVHIPFDLQTLVKKASGQGALDVPSYLETAQHDGLCIRVGGAQMWGSALFSNLARAPLEIRDDSLVVAP